MVGYQKPEELSLIPRPCQGLCGLHFMQREIDEEGCIIASKEDFEAAVRLYGSRAGLQKLHVTEAEKRFMQVLDQEGGEADTATMMIALNISSNRVYQIAQRLRVKLQGFDIEKRSVLTDDDGGKQSTQKNVYRLHRSLTLADYESVVWLKDDDPSEGVARQEAPEPHSNPMQSPDVLPAQRAQNGDISQNKDYNHKINNSCIPLEGLSGICNEERSLEYSSAHRRLCTAREASSGNKMAEHNVEIGPAPSKRDAGGSDDKSCGWASDGLNCSSGASSAITSANQSDLAPIIQQADFEGYVCERLERLANGDCAEPRDPEFLCNFTVAQYCDDREVASDKQSRIVLAQLFNDLVNGNGPAASVFLNLTHGKPLLIAGNEHVQ